MLEIIDCPHGELMKFLRNEVRCDYIGVRLVEGRKEG
jgi:hypothetical protein